MYIFICLYVHMKVPTVTRSPLNTTVLFAGFLFENVPDRLDSAFCNLLKISGWWFQLGGGLNRH